ncbi:NmrA family protein [Xylaria grammica]|nr:NmrA family protein [Xylaria grammica]
MDASKPTVFVCGATGAQGGALCRQLRGLDWGVHAITRNLESPEAKALTTIGVKLAPGDYDNTDALKAGLAGCDKLFLCLYPVPEDPPHEQRQSEAIVSIAKDAGIAQIILSTSLGVSLYGEDDRLVPGTLLHRVIQAKYGAEKAVIGAGLDSWTILRPGFFMSNFTEPSINMYSDILKDHRWINVLRPDTSLGLIDPADIAAYAVAAFRDPVQLHARIVGLGSEFLTPQQTMNRLSRAMNIQGIKAVCLSDDQISTEDQSNALYIMTKGEKSMRYSGPEYIDLEAISQVIRRTTFEEFLVREKDKVKRF